MRNPLKVVDNDDLDPVGSVVEFYRRDDWLGCTDKHARTLAARFARVARFSPTLALG